MARPRVRVYTDYKSPFAYIANKRLFEIEEQSRRRAGMAALYAAHSRIHGRGGGAHAAFLAQGALLLHGRAAARQRARADHQGPATHLQRLLRQRRHAVRAAPWLLPSLSRHGVQEILDARARRRRAAGDLRHHRFARRLGGRLRSLCAMAMRAPSTIASSTKPKSSACSACPPWCSTTNCSGAPIASTCWSSASRIPKASPPRSAAGIASKQREPSASMAVQSAGTRRKLNLTPRNIGRSICVCCTCRGCEAPASRLAGIADRQVTGRQAGMRTMSVGPLLERSMTPPAQTCDLAWQGHGAR